MPITIERIIEGAELGEGPHWDVASQSLYFVDIFQKAIHKYHPATKVHTHAVVGSKNVSFVIPVEGATNRFVISYGFQIAVVTWDGVSTTVSKMEIIAEVAKEAKDKEISFNDAKADSSGRLWTGTLAFDYEGGVLPNVGSLYSLKNKKLKHHVSNITIANGIAWSLDNKQMYYIDSHTFGIDQFDFDIQTGTISNRQTIFTFAKHGISGLPDGQTIDADGNLWIAVFNGGKVIKINPRTPETLLKTVELPAKQITSVMFGGSNLDELYVTSGRVHMGENTPATLPLPNNGATFKITGVGAKGVPAVNVKI